MEVDVRVAAERGLHARVHAVLRSQHHACIRIHIMRPLAPVDNKQLTIREQSDNKVSSLRQSAHTYRVANRSDREGSCGSARKGAGNSAAAGTGLVRAGSSRTPGRRTDLRTEAGDEVNRASERHVLRM